MSTQFSRSMRSLKSDNFRASIIGMILFIVILVLLIIWFFGVETTLYEHSADVKLSPNGQFTAEFTDQAMERIQSGQYAVLKVKAGGDSRSVSVPAIVIGTQPESNQVVFVIVADDVPMDIFQEGLKGEVEVEVEYLTPAELVMQSSGAFSNQADIPLSPQQSGRSNQ